MPVDPAGTAPGLQPGTEEPVVHNMRCKNKNCDSITVTTLPIPLEASGGRRMYRCTKCNTTWGVQVGGSIDI